MKTGNRRPYVAVLRAPSNARFRPGQGVRLESLKSAEGPVTLLLTTRHQDVGKEATVPRELWIEVRGEAASLDAARDAFFRVGREFAPIISFEANVRVGHPEVHLVIEKTPGANKREFLEVFLPDERGLIREGRFIDTGLLLKLINGFGRHSDASRLGRALGHYQLALDKWFIGGESLTLAHLFIAAETLTPAVIRALTARDGLSDEDRARQFGLDPDADKNWRKGLHSETRRTHVFHGDTETSRKAREASDGLEHGYMELADINERARAVTEMTFGYVRECIIDLLGLSADDRTALMDKEPLDVQSLRRMVRGHFVGDADDLAAPDQEYPILEWISSIDRLWWDENEHLQVVLNEKLKVICAEGVGFRGKRYEVHGRGKPGVHPIDRGTIPISTDPP